MAKAKNEAKIKFLAETEEFRANITKVNSSMSELRSELKLNAEQMKTNGTSADGLAERHKILEAQLGQAEEKTKNLAAQMEAAKRLYGENSNEAQKLATQVNNARVAEEKIKQEINKVNAQLEEFKTDANNAGDAAENLGDDVKAAGNAAKDAEGGFTVLKGTLANLASNAITAVSSKIGEFGSTLWNLGDETRELRTEMGKLDAAFSASGYSSETAAATYERLYGVIGETDQSVEAAQQIALLSNNTQDAAKWADLAAGVVGRFGDALQPETFFEAANETLKLGEATGAYTQMLEGTGMSVDKFNEGLAAARTEEEKQAYMLEVTNKALGAAGEAYKQNNAQIIEANAAQSNYNNGLAGLGHLVEPLKTTFMNGMAGMLESATQFLSGFDIEGLKTKIQGAFDYINTTVFPAIKTGIQWFLDNKDLIIAGIGGIVAGIAAFKVVSIVQTAVGIFKAFQAATVGLTAAQKLLNLVMMANPIGLVVVAIAGLVAAFVVLWNKCESFRNFWINLWEGIKTAVGPVAESIKNAFVQAWELIKVVWSYVAPYFTTIWENIKIGVGFLKDVLVNVFKLAWEGIRAVWAVVSGWFKAVWDTIAGIFSVVKSVLSGDFQGAWEAIKGIVSSWAGYFQTVWNAIKNVFSAVGTFFKNIFTSAWNAIKGIVSNWVDFFKGVWDGIKNVFSKVGSWFKGIFSDAWNGIKNIWSGVKSWFGGVWDGIKNVFSNVGSWFKNIFTDAWNGIKNAWSNVKSWFSGIWDGIKNVFGSVHTWFKTKFTEAWTNIKNVFSNWGSFFTGLWDKIKNTFSGLGTKLGDAIGGSVKSALNKVFGWVESTLNKGIGLINSAIGLINKIPGVNVGTIGNVTLPRLASGGVLTGETAFIGGEYPGARTNPEIVTPQSIMRETFAEVLSANIENMLHLDRLASAIEKLADRPINVDVDGYRLATATAGASDAVSGNRLNLKNRGLAL